VSTIKVQYECPLCGSAGVDLPENFTDDSIASCSNSNCDATFGRWGDIKDRTRRAVAQTVTEKLRSIPGGINTIH
jgi:hypothetical protein